MRIDRVLFPVSTLGPGRRVAIWTSGCSKRCAGCTNPELWESTGDQEIPTGELAGSLATLSRDMGAHRLTLTGGDPLEQAGELARLLGMVRHLYDDVLLYTGYGWDEASPVLSREAPFGLGGLVDVVIDGPYVRELNDGRVPLRGSTNQGIQYLTPSLRAAYEDYMGTGRQVQNFVVGTRVISVGIHGTEGGGPWES